MYQPLVIAEQREQLLANTRRFALGDLHDIEQIHPVVRLFTPDAHATGLLA